MSTQDSNNRTTSKNAPSSAEIETPCDGNCVIDPDTGYCEGCQRTMTEIARWTKMTPEARAEVINQLEPRRLGLVGPAED